MSGTGERCEEEHLAGHHVRQEQASLSGTHQLAEYVASLEVGECARILAHSPIPLPTVTKRDARSRVRVLSLVEGN